MPNKIEFYFMLLKLNIKLHMKKRNETNVFVLIMSKKRMFISCPFLKHLKYILIQVI